MQTVHWSSCAPVPGGALFLLVSGPGYRRSQVLRWKTKTTPRGMWRYDVSTRKTTRKRRARVRDERMLGLLCALGVGVSADA